MRFGLSDAELAALGARPLARDDPQRVGPFRLLGVLGTGGMGRVYLGSAKGGLAAVKVIRAELADSPRFRRRFGHELQAVRRLGGAFTAGLIDADADAARPWMATEYVAGPSVSDVVEEHGALPVPALWRLAAGVASALAAFHDVGIVHRDLKPSNVILALDGPKVIDFGIAQAADLSQVTVTGQHVGTPSYMAPEQARTGRVGAASDVFALGGMLVFAATGRPPFGEGSPTAVLFRVVHEPPDLSGLLAVDAELHALVVRCLDKDPVRRPAAAAVAATAAEHPVEEWPEGLRERIVSPTLAVTRAWSADPVEAPDTATTAPGTPDLPHRAPAGTPARRRVLVAVGIAALLATLGGVTAGLLMTQGSSGPRSALAAEGSSPSSSAGATASATSAAPSGASTSAPVSAGPSPSESATRPAGGGAGAATTSAPAAPATSSAPSRPARTVTATVRPTATASSAPARPWDSCDYYSGTELTEQGDTGSRVTEVQCILKARGYDIGSSGVDGDFGPDTLAAVKKFQSDHGLEVDGQVGPHTWAALRA